MEREDGGVVLLPPIRATVDGDESMLAFRKVPPTRPLFRWCLVRISVLAATTNLILDEFQSFMPSRTRANSELAHHHSVPSPNQLM